MFFIYFCLFNQKLQILLQIDMWKMSIQYMVPGFELTTFQTWASFHNHKTSGQSYKHFTLVNYESRVIIWDIFKSGTTLES